MVEDASRETQGRPFGFKTKKVHAFRPDHRNAGTLDVLGFLRSVRNRAAHASQVGDVVVRSARDLRHVAIVAQASADVSALQMRADGVRRIAGFIGRADSTDTVRTCTAPLA